MKSCFLLGIDVGTTATKTVIVDLNGKLLAEASIGHKLNSPKTGWAEEDPRSWWIGTKKTIRECLIKSKINPKDIAGIGISGLASTLVLINKAGEPLRPAILYNDMRAIEEMNWIRENIGDDKIFEVTGRVINVEMTSPKILWLKKYEPKKLNETKKILEPNAFVIYKLTGEFSVERGFALEAGLLDLKKRNRYYEIFELLDISMEKLPKLYQSYEIVGEVHGEAAEATGLTKGIPVVAGGLDGVCSVLGAGVIDEGEASITYGGTGCIFLCTSKLKQNRRLYIDYHCVPGKYLLNGAMATSGILLRWFKDQFCQVEKDVGAKKGVNPYKILDSKAENIAPGSDGLIILPYFMGEKTPIFDPLARGVIFGLTLHHTRHHIFRSFLESVAYGFYHHIEIFRELGCTLKRVVAVDGGAKSKLWRQIVSDVINMPQEYVAGHPGAPLGSAFLAGIGTRQIKRWKKIKDWNEISDTTLPRMDAHEKYLVLYHKYRQIYEHLKSDFR